MWFNRVRIFISGSAPLSEQSLNDFNAKFKRAKLLEGYGLSECSPTVSVNRLHWQKPFSVGLPLPEIQIKIVNEERMEELVEKSLMLVTALSPHIGYEKSAEIAKKAFKDNIPLGALAIGTVG